MCQSKSRNRSCYCTECSACDYVLRGRFFMCVCAVQGVPGPHPLQVGMAKLEQLRGIKRSQMRPSGTPLHSLTPTVAARVLGMRVPGKDSICLGKSVLSHAGHACSREDSKDSGRRLLHQAQSQLALRHRRGCQVQREWTSCDLPTAHKEEQGQWSVCISVSNTGKCPRDVLEVQLR